ncbi:MAG: hypothetical protein ACN6O7_09490 [Sphingobacterium sp.]
MDHEKRLDLDENESNSLIIEPVDIINPDQKVAEKALKSLSKEQDKADLQNLLNG